ncbi:Surfactin synthase subunit 2 [compost metagenome]
MKTREENIGVNRNFFDLGGNSLKLIGLVGKINQHFNASLSVASLFELSTIRLQAGRIHQVTEIGPDAEEENLSASELESMVSLFNTDEGD